MIFATVGTQLPFDRLLLAVDTWASMHRDVPVVAQTGRTATTYSHLTCLPQMDQRRYADCVAQARVIVAHAGMGSILTAIEAGKPVILMPRRADLGEHRNDHQRDTAAEMAVLSNVTVVEDSATLCTAISAALTRANDPALAARSNVASARLLDAVRDFIWSEDTRSARSGFGLRPVLRA
ncbi:glycosyl transferase family 28 [Fertoebacter nigrum]|uniref:Glycosyl transferase family 28 n=1 Tax=Fertoeibacter niger TaxID=2656921 RepID=A0A8X8H675_9RHOB|nr:glycosyltransferase [Fertoeibacter niger]NUB46448.1 glycosyl transferase family 28 [Fertoeibacter niger]